MTKYMIILTILIMGCGQSKEPQKHHRKINYDPNMEKMKMKHDVYIKNKVIEYQEGYQKGYEEAKIKYSANTKGINLPHHQYQEKQYRYFKRESKLQGAGIRVGGEWELYEIDPQEHSKFIPAVLDEQDIKKAEKPTNIRGEFKHE